MTSKDYLTGQNHKQNDIIYIADFETSKYANKTWVYLWSVSPLNSNEFYNGYDIISFINFIQKHSGRYYFHNAKFDVSFIISYLLKNGFVYSEKKIPNSIQTLYSGNGNFYSCKINFSYVDKRNKKINSSTILDSQKLLISSVEQIANDFKLPIKKLKIDYNKIILENSKIDKEFIEYVNRDVEIVKIALKDFLMFGDKITIASNALNKYKLLTQDFEKLFPVLSFQEDEYLRKSYKGGFCWKHPKIRDVEKGLVFDVNSLYPYVMYTKLLPCYKPIYTKGELKFTDNFPLFIQHIKVACHIKENKIPCIQLKHNFRYAENQYLTEIDYPEDLYVTNIDLTLIKEHYDINYIDYIDGYYFKGKYGLFKGYIDYFMDLKYNGNPSERAIAKRYLNSLYGKFGKNPVSTRKIPYIEDDILKFHTTDLEISNPIYVAMASFITSYAREKTIRTAQKFYCDDLSKNRFIYSDTDSIHILGHEIPDLDIDDKKLGYWKLENKFYKGRFIRQKTYYEISGKEHTIKCAGMSDKMKSKLSFKKFTEGYTDFRLKQKQLDGGIALVDEIFTIK